MDNKKIFTITIIMIFIIIIVQIIKSNNTSNNSTQNNTINNVEEVDLTIDDKISNFYTTDILNKYIDIRDLNENYDKEAAQVDNCFVIGAMVHNDYLYYEFMEKYRNNESAFIRVVQNTTEGDSIIYDIKYDSNTKKILIIADNTRDKYSADSDRKIDIKEYSKIGEYAYMESLYWIAYNDDVTDENFESENVFVITRIN